MSHLNSKTVFHRNEELHVLDAVIAVQRVCHVDVNHVTEPRPRVAETQADAGKDS